MRKTLTLETKIAILEGTRLQTAPPATLPAPKKRGCLAIYSTPVTSSSVEAIVFCDDGSDASWLTEGAIKKLGAKKVGPDITLKMTTLHGCKDVPSAQFEVILLVPGMGEVSIIAYSTPSISSQISGFNPSNLKKIFPKYNIAKLRHPTGPIDLLLGTDYFSLHPKQEKVRNGDLSIMAGPLGECVVGYHPLLNKSASGGTPDSSTSSFVSVEATPTHPADDTVGNTGVPIKSSPVSLLKQHPQLEVTKVDDPKSPVKCVEPSILSPPASSEKQNKQMDHTEIGDHRTPITSAHADITSDAVLPRSRSKQISSTEFNDPKTAAVYQSPTSMERIPDPACVVSMSTQSTAQAESNDLKIIAKKNPSSREDHQATSKLNLTLLKLLFKVPVSIVRKIMKVRSCNTKIVDEPENAETTDAPELQVRSCNTKIVDEPENTETAESTKSQVRSRNTKMFDQPENTESTACRKQYTPEEPKESLCPVVTSEAITAPLVYQSLAEISTTVLLTSLLVVIPARHFLLVNSWK